MAGQRHPFGSFGGMLAGPAKAIWASPLFCGFVFAFAIFFSTFVFNIFMMNLPIEGDPVDFGAYFRAVPSNTSPPGRGILWYLRHPRGPRERLRPGAVAAPSATRFLLMQGLAHAS